MFDIVDRIIETITSLFGDVKRVVAVGCGILVAMCVVAVAALLMGRKPEEVPDAPVAKLELNDVLLLPPVKVYDGQYITSRQTPQNWQTEQVKEWYTYPTEEQLQDLHKINSMFTKEIVQSAP